MGWLSKLKSGLKKTVKASLDPRTMLDPRRMMKLGAPVGMPVPDPRGIRKLAKARSFWGAAKVAADPRRHGGGFLP
jgi:hypothetical protein